MRSAQDSLRGGQVKRLGHDAEGQQLLNCAVARGGGSLALGANTECLRTSAYCSREIAASIGCCIA